MRSVHQSVKQPSIRPALHVTLLMLCLPGATGATRAAERQSLPTLRPAVIELAL